MLNSNQPPRARVTFKLCAVIPTHNHFEALSPIVASLRGAELEVIVIDDASPEPAKSTIAALHAPHNGIEIIRLAINGGKGAAVTAGLYRARDRGFTHALQIDADGQHDLVDLPKFLAQATAHPDALITGQPMYDASVPKGRLYGR